ncbi:hypothetical protein ACHAPT_002453 [Fusarium lateritium]
MPSQSQYVDSNFLFPHGYRDGNKCLGWSRSFHRLCNNPIGQGKHLRHLHFIEQLNELTPAEKISSHLLEQAVELHLCCLHKDNHLASEVEKAQRRLMIAIDDSERQEAAQAQPARTRSRLPENITPAARLEAPVATRRSPAVRVSTARIPAAHTPGARFASSTRNLAPEPLVAHAPSPRPATARRVAPVGASAARPATVNDYTSTTYNPATRAPQARVAATRIPPPCPPPPRPAVRFWESTAEYGGQFGAQPEAWSRDTPRRARLEPLTPPTSPPSFRDSTPDSDVTVGRYPPSNAATIYIPSDCEDESDNDWDDEESEDASSRGYPSGFWTRYDEKWDSLQYNGRIRGKALEEQIPWPVHGINYPTPENVEAFYHDAIAGYATRGDRILLMGIECQRWAPKNLKKVLGKRIFKGMFAETLQMIHAVARDYHDRLISQTGQ